ncbi:hypothetical protein SAMIE_1006170 [Sphingobium amiense]|uniref:Uncharacterized protein n=2 Tax=Sphingobium amiense TaxID=135719 RepID=A0A494W1B8_9SPHN|nr:hypothetical protein [Sphingobium amiense]BBD97116.1 hypothetical protein SAMIE_1006170 [Sphingobium amiense]
MAELDKSLQLEAVYYSAPAPRSLASIVALGLVFDRVHFPGVYVPQGDYDRDAWKAEIDRIAALPPSRFNDPRALVTLMKFAELSERMPGFFAFDRTKDDPLDKNNGDSEMVERMYAEMWGPPSKNFIPTFAPWHHKGVPGSDEHLTYPGDYYYQAAALRKSGELGAPLVSDMPGLPVPGAAGDMTGDAKALSGFLALQTMRVALDGVPLLAPDDIMEFRNANSQALRAFRRAMLRYAGEWRDKLKELPPEEVVRETAFLVQTEIVPALDELRQLASDPARPWYKRAVDGIKMAAALAGACMMADKEKAFGAMLAAAAPMFFTEVEAKGDKSQTVRRSDLYYLLKLQRVG